jgi:hypothetical protein
MDTPVKNGYFTKIMTNLDNYSSLLLEAIPVYGKSDPAIVTISY